MAKNAKNAKKLNVITPPPPHFPYKTLRAVGNISPQHVIRWRSELVHRRVLTSSEPPTKTPRYVSNWGDLTGCAPQNRTLPHWKNLQIWSESGACLLQLWGNACRSIESGPHLHGTVHSVKKYGLSPAIPISKLLYIQIVQTVQLISRLNPGDSHFLNLQVSTIGLRSRRVDLELPEDPHDPAAMVCWSQGICHSQ